MLFKLNKTKNKTHLKTESKWKKLSFKVAYIESIISSKIQLIKVNAKVKS